MNSEVFQVSESRLHTSAPIASTTFARVLLCRSVDEDNPGKPATTTTRVLTLPLCSRILISDAKGPSAMATSTRSAPACHREPGHPERTWPSPRTAAVRQNTATPKPRHPSPVASHIRYASEPSNVPQRRPAITKAAPAMHAIAIVAVTNGFGNKRRPITTSTIIAEARLKPHLRDAES